MTGEMSKQERATLALQQYKGWVEAQAGMLALIELLVRQGEPVGDLWERFKILVRVAGVDARAAGDALRVLEDER